MKRKFACVIEAVYDWMPVRKIEMTVEAESIADAQYAITEIIPTLRAPIDTEHWRWLKLEEMKT